jgi:hypothetical protein
MALNKELVDQQMAVCLKHKADYCPSPDYLKVGVALNVKEGLRPINGLRHPVEGDTTGWYIWAGEELPNDPDFFQPLHVEHLSEWCPEAQKYLGLPPGWRFLIDGEYEDVWYDESLRACK